MDKIDLISEEISVKVPGKSAAKLAQKRRENNFENLSFFLGGQINMTVLRVGCMYQIVCKHFLHVPCTCFDLSLSLTLFETSNLQKTRNKKENNFKTLFFPSIDPLNRLVGAYLGVFVGGYLGGVWDAFWKYLDGILMVKPTKKQPKTTPKVFY